MRVFQEVFENCEACGGIGRNQETGEVCEACDGLASFPVDEDERMDLSKYEEDCEVDEFDDCYECADCGTVIEISEVCPTCWVESMYRYNR